MPKGRPSVETVLLLHVMPKGRPSVERVLCYM